MAEPAGPEPEPLQLSVKHTTAMFGTDFDVVVEVRARAAAECSAQVLRHGV